MSTSVKERIEAEYDACYKDRTRDLNPMCELLYDYVRSVVAMVIKKGDYIDLDTVSELTQDIMIIISTEVIYTFEKKEAKFTTYCARIAKNKALDYVRKRDRRELVDYDKVMNENLLQEDEGKDASLPMAGRNIYKNPELLLIQQERRLEQIGMLKNSLQLLMDYDAMPYRVVSCCYSMVLFHKYHPNTKVLGSPKWAYDELKMNTVEEGADRYYKEINEWFPTFHLSWGDQFQDGMDEMENGVYVSDIVYGDRFNVHLFENWCLQTRANLNEQMFGQVEEVLE